MSELGLADLLNNDQPSVVAEELDNMVDRENRRQKIESERDQAYKIRDGILTQLDAGDNPCIILYNAIECIGLLTHDDEFLQTAKEYFNAGYAELSAQSNLINDLLMQTDELREKQNSRIATLKRSILRQSKSIETIKTQMDSLLTTVDDLDKMINADASAPVPITRIVEQVQQVSDVDSSTTDVDTVITTQHVDDGDDQKQDIVDTANEPNLLFVEFNQGDAIAPDRDQLDTPAENSDEKSDSGERRAGISVPHSEASTGFKDDTPTTEKPDDDQPGRDLKKTYKNPRKQSNPGTADVDPFPLSKFGNLLFYDIEVFQDDALVVFKDIKKNVVAEYWLTDNQLTQTRGDAVDLTDLVESHTLVGYNNHNYDDHILDLIMYNGRNAVVKAKNDTIIGGHSGKPLYQMHTIDCTLQIDGANKSRGKDGSPRVIPPALKKIESCLGRSIEESPVSFDIDRPLTAEEKHDVEFYCEADVDATVDVYRLRYKSYFEPKHSMIDLLPEDSRSRQIEHYKTTTALVPEIVLRDDKPEIWKSYHFGPKHDLIMSTCPDDVRQMWDADNPFANSNPDDNRKVTRHEFGCKIDFGFGGLHGINDDGRREFRDVKLLDVTSMYPSIMINLNVFGPATARYEEIVEMRKKVKHTDPVLQSALKLVINATSGCLRYKNSRLYNPAVHRAICFYGQLSLYDLSRRLYDAGYQLINLNTDGVAFTGSGDAWKQIQADWSEFWDLQLELKEYDYFYQKDVNNYIAYRENPDGEPSVKVIGGDLGKYADFADPESGRCVGKSHFTGYGNTCGIVTKCLYEYLVHSTDPIESIENNLDQPYLYQFTLNTGNVYKATVDQHGREYQKVNRVFASIGDDNCVTLKKLKADGSLTKYGNVPNNQFVYNGDLSDLDPEAFHRMIDVGYYLDLANKKIQAWDPDAIKKPDPDQLVMTTDDNFFDNFFD